MRLTSDFHYDCILVIYTVLHAWTSWELQNPGFDGTEVLLFDVWMLGFEAFR